MQSYLWFNEYTGLLIGWYCKGCKRPNKLGPSKCRFCGCEKPAVLELATNKYNELEEIAQNRIEQMDDAKVELHAKFFNSEILFVADMTDEQLTDRRNELSNIIFEARARYNAADEETRTRRAKKGDKSWLVTPEIGPNVTERIDLPKERAKRQSRADKLLETMKSLGVENPEELIKNVERAQSGGSVTSHHSRTIEDKRENITFNKPNSNTNDSLLGDISDSLTNSIKSDRPIDDLVKAAVTAGHLANNTLGRTSKLCKLGQHEQCNGQCSCSCHSDTQKPTVETKKPFNVDELFG